mgnify:CR=1 FL=1
MTASRPSDCPLCQRILRLGERSDSALIHEFPQSYWLVGEHQFFHGYTLLLHKAHVRELHDLSPAVSQAFYDELMIASRAVAAVCAPWKMNVSSFGNQVPHLHWHLMPRYDDDPERLRPPWDFSSQFAAHLTSPAEAAALASRLRAAL